ncbi:MAG: hypothetical protein ACQKBT_08120 [Puniceicoccales bacterium]
MRLGSILSLLCGIVTVGGLSPALLGESRTFTNQEGQTIEATLESVDDGFVEIRRDDGRLFTIPLATLSKKDQDYVEGWLTGRALSDERRFEISAKRFDENETTSSPTGLLVEERDGFYEITLENRTDTDLEDLEVHWAMRVEKTSPGAVKGRKTDVWTKGKIPNVDVDDDEEVELETERVLLREVKLKPGYVWISDAPKNSRDKLDGIYVAIFYNGEMVREYSLPSGALEEGRDALRQEEQEKILFGK